MADTKNSEALVNDDSVCEPSMPSRPPPPSKPCQSFPAGSVARLWHKAGFDRGIGRAAPVDSQSDLTREAVNPGHYRADPSGVECITVTEHRSFCIGNAMKYLWRAGLKGDIVEDLRKSIWYIEREIARLSGQK